MGLEPATPDSELSALTIWPQRQMMKISVIFALFILWIQFLRPLLGLAWSIFRKVLMLFEIYMENGVYRRIGKKWPDFLTTLLCIHSLDYCWTFLCGDDKIMSEYWWSERIFRRRCAFGRAGLDLSCLACHGLRLLSDSIVDPWRVQAYQWRRVCTIWS